MIGLTRGRDATWGRANGAAEGEGGARRGGKMSRGVSLALDGEEGDGLGKGKGPVMRGNFARKGRLNSSAF